MPVRPAQLELWRVHFADAAELNRLARALDIWEVDHVGRFAVAPLSGEQQALLANEGYTVQRDERTLETVATSPEESTLEVGTIPGFPCYRTVAATYSDLEALARQHPDLAQWIDIGDSWERTQGDRSEGHDIGALVLTSKKYTAPKFHFLVTGAVHARELVTAELATRFAEYLVDLYGVDPDVTWLLDYGEVHVIPIANPDGRKMAEQGYLWRKNTNNSDGCLEADPLGLCYGVDLNRNSSFQWASCSGEGCSSADSCAVTYRGSAPASEPETTALQDYAQAIFYDQRGPGLQDAADASASGLFITLHSYGQLVMFPWGWSDTPTPNDAGLRTLARKLAEPLGYRSCQAGEWGCLYQTDGSNDDWVYGELGVAAFTFELGTAFFELCFAFEETLLPDAVQALTLAFKAARAPYTLADAPEITSFDVSPARLTAGMPVTATVSAALAAPLQARAESERLTLRYSVDTPSWITSTTVVTITEGITVSDPSEVTLSATLDTSGFAPGRHLVLMEAAAGGGGGPAGSPRAAWLDVVEAAADFDASAEPAKNTGAPGMTVSYSIAVTNTGLVPDTYAGSVISSSWPVRLQPESLALAEGQQGAISVAVEIPSNTKPGEADIARIRLASTLDTTVSRVVRLRTSAAPHAYYYPFVSASKPHPPE